MSWIGRIRAFFHHAIFIAFASTAIVAEDATAIVAEDATAVAGSPAAGAGGPTATPPDFFGVGMLMLMNCPGRDLGVNSSTHPRK